MIIKPVAAVLIVALLVVGVVVSTFIYCGFSANVESILKVEIGVDHEPAPVIHYHIKKEGVWAAGA